MNSIEGLELSAVNLDEVLEILKQTKKIEELSFDLLFFFF